MIALSRTPSTSIASARVPLSSLTEKDKIVRFAGCTVDPAVIMILIIQYYDIILCML